MSELRLYLYDDAQARSWQPFALTRPVGELLLGAHTFRERAEGIFGVHCAGHITAPHLRGFEEPGAPPVVAAEQLSSTQPNLFINSRVVLDWDDIPLPDGAALLRIGDAVAGRYVPAGKALPNEAWFSDPMPAAGESVEVKGRVIERVWDLIAENPAQIGRDFDARGTRDLHVGEPPVQSIAYSDGALRMGRDVVIEPGALFDFSHGPIWLDDRVTVRAFTRLAGPAYVGPGSTLLGGPYEAISIGPTCRVHGEVEESIMLGFSNKAHDGFLGHAYLGRWVNLGALTTNSDLKNNYGTIRMWTPEGEVDTGLIKLGCLLGDHVKTGIGALINTGTIVGAGSNLFGTEMPPKYVAPFSWGSGSDLVPYRADKFLTVAATVMSRRQQQLPESMRDMLERAWSVGRNEDA